MTKGSAVGVFASRGPEEILAAALCQMTPPWLLDGLNRQQVHARENGYRVQTCQGAQQ